MEKRAIINALLESDILANMLKLSSRMTVRGAQQVGKSRGIKYPNQEVVGIAFSTLVVMDSSDGPPDYLINMRRNSAGPIGK